MGLYIRNDGDSAHPSSQSVGEVRTRSRQGMGRTIQAVLDALARKGIRDEEKHFDPLPLLRDRSRA
jgi:hypothetical protein